MNEDINKQILKFNILYKKYDYLYRSAARRFDMCELEFMILYVLRSFNSEKSKCTQKNLTDILLHPKQSINSALKSLTRKGLVKLEAPSPNQRLKYIYLTEDGTKIAEKTADVLIEAEKGAFAFLSSEERNTLLSLFGKLTDLIEERFGKITDADDKI